VRRLLADITPLRQSPDYRRLWLGQALANIGVMLTVTAVSLQVYDLTGSSLAVGLLGGCSLLPVVLLGLYGGSWADRYDRRKVALAASCVMWSATLGIVAQAYVDLGNVVVLYLLVAAQSGATTVSSAARSAIIPRLVPREQLPAANALGTMSISVATLCGPVAGAGLVASIGYGPTYLIDAVAYTAALYALFKLPPMPPQAVAGQPSISTWRSVGEGLAFLATRRNLLMTFLTDMCAMILSMPRAAFPAIAALVIGGGETTVGLLTGFLALGTLSAAVFSGPVGRLRWQGRGVVVAVVSWGLAIAFTGAVIVLAGRTQPQQVIWWALVAAGIGLALAGAADTVSSVFRGTILQAAAPDHLRGRIQGVFVVVVTGGPRLGDVATGLDSDLLGEGWAMVVGGLACAVAVLLLTRWHAAFWRYDSLNPVP
jgi:ENTS family enterobactin (siderophore) exporter